MTAAAKPPLAEYVEDGTTLAFPAPFRFRSQADLEVKRIAPGGAVSTLAGGSAWSATGGDTDAGGTITLTATIAGARLRIRRRTTRAQETDYATSDTFPAESHEEALDRLALVDQEQDVQIADLASRAPQVPEGEIAPAYASLAGLIDGDILEFRGGRLRAIDRNRFIGKYYFGGATGAPEPVDTGIAASGLAELAQGDGALVGIGGGRSLKNLASAMPLYASLLLFGVTVPDAAGLQYFVNYCTTLGRPGVWDFTYTEIETDSVVLPAELDLLVRAGAELRWTGGEAVTDNGVVLRTGGDNISIGCEGQGEWYMTSETPDHMRWAIELRGARDNFQLRGLRCHNLKHTLADTSAADYYAVELGMNSPSNIIIEAGGCDFDVMGPHLSGAVMLSHVSGARVSGMTMRNVPMGIQAWGGNANPAVHGAKANPRKCRDIEVFGCIVNGSAACWIFFSMCERALARDCTGDDAGDVGFDTEGGDGTFINCRGRNATNGVFSIFFLCGNIKWKDCWGRQDDPALQVGVVVNPSQTTENDTLQIENCDFEAGGGAGSMPAFINISSAVRNLVVDGGTGLWVRWNIAGNNHLSAIVKGLYLEYRQTAGAAFDALVMDQFHPSGLEVREQASGVVQGAIIRTRVAQPAGSRGIYMRADDLTSNPVLHDVDGGEVVGFPASVVMDSAATNGVGQLIGTVRNLKTDVAPAIGVANSGVFNFIGNRNTAGVLYT